MRRGTKDDDHTLAKDMAGVAALTCLLHHHEGHFLELPHRLGRAAAVRSLRNAVQRHNPDILGVAETKIQNAPAVLQRLGFPNSFVCHPQGRKVGLLVAGRADFDVVSSNCNFIRFFCVLLLPI